ncbi:PREDICTED: zinc finger protein CONSTANS-LIKE 7 [Nelumbo nucifera]|uniref:Zinc finger protein CONSTANS-LIKE 7 n=2 Tax=Nelumbo nucifera TaxID=4432 RepID=A0A1U8AFV7_NELNU|nr:PREDICTED: zinc finger protein CONSTANS-LIKE 7 [Nelumbo nucifera]DAD28110.1 TPA_asm: hypothetical protein HUJ06_029578 [Nelumbo nucifera]
MGRYNSFLRSPKQEEQQVPDTAAATEESSESKAVHSFTREGYNIMGELEDILDAEDDDEKFAGQNLYDNFKWDFMDWAEFPDRGQLKEGDDDEVEDDNVEIGHWTTNNSTELSEDQSHYANVIKRETVVLWEEDEEKLMSLNLNLNYQNVLDAWSDRGSLWADDTSLSMVNHNFIGEVPVMEEERLRREARVLRYKEKRQNRLFSKKIRYQVRKLNAEKRPRLKGRFVKRTLPADKILR